MKPIPHKHADLIKAWADGAEIEVMHAWSRGWVDAGTPSWDEGASYRVKQKISQVKVDTRLSCLQLKFTIENDGVMYKFIDVELVK